MTKMMGTPMHVLVPVCVTYIVLLLPSVTPLPPFPATVPSLHLAGKQDTGEMFLNDTDNSGEPELLEREKQDQDHKVPVRSVLDDTDNTGEPEVMEREEQDNEPKVPVFNASLLLDTRIINGNDAEISQRPFQVWIGNCGGSLILSDWVLTAAHCVTDDSGIIPNGDRWVLVGSDSNHWLGSWFQEYQYLKKNAIFVHPSWTGSLGGSSIDLALMQLPKPFALSANAVETIALNDNVSNFRGRKVTVSGWGRTERKTSPTQLMQADLVVTRIANGVITLSQEAGRGVCMGDSGGPATIKDSNGRNLLVGVASYGTNPNHPDDPCGPGINNGLGLFTQATSNYVHVYDHVNWIRNTISANPGAQCNGKPSTDWSCCSSSNPCTLGGGDCDYDSHCAGNLKCGSNNCKRDFSSSGSSWSSSADCCVGGCDCDYHWGGCKISEAANRGFKCKCNYASLWTCTGSEVRCSNSEIASSKCPGSCGSEACCKTGGGDCGGY